MDLHFSLSSGFYEERVDVYISPGKGYLKYGTCAMGAREQLWESALPCGSQLRLPLSDDSSLYQVDIKLDSTLNEISCDGNKV